MALDHTPHSIKYERKALLQRSCRAGTATSVFYNTENVNNNIYLLEITVNSGGGGGRGSYSAGLCLLSEGFLFFGRLWFISLTALCSAQQYQMFSIYSMYRTKEE